jgi:cytochrome c oxidase cbb3-type subunit 3
LTDSFWLHGSSPEKIEATILNGVVEKGMPAWEPVLGKETCREVTAYVISLKGTKPANPKEPQGIEETAQ